MVTGSLLHQTTHPDHAQECIHARMHQAGQSGSANNVHTLVSISLITLNALHAWLLRSAILTIPVSQCEQHVAAFRNLQAIATTHIQHRHLPPLLSTATLHKPTEPLHMPQPRPSIPKQPNVSRQNCTSAPPTAPLQPVSFSNTTIRRAAAAAVHKSWVGRQHPLNMTNHQLLDQCKQGSNAASSRCHGCKRDKPQYIIHVQKCMCRINNRRHCLMELAAAASQQSA